MLASWYSKFCGLHIHVLSFCWLILCPILTQSYRWVASKQGFPETIRACSTVLPWPLQLPAPAVVLGPRNLASQVAEQKPSHKTSKPIKRRESHNRSNLQVQAHLRASYDLEDTPFCRSILVRKLLGWIPKTCPETPQNPSTLIYA